MIQKTIPVKDNLCNSFRSRLFGNEFAQDFGTANVSTRSFHDRLGTFMERRAQARHRRNSMAMNIVDELAINMVCALED
jgi:hypothetical protein